MKNDEFSSPQAELDHRGKGCHRCPSAKGDVAGWLCLFAMVLLLPWLPAEAQSLSGYPEIEYASPDQSV